MNTALMANRVECEERFFTARDGIRLFFRGWYISQARGLVGLVHGFAEHCGRYDELAYRLNQAGWSVAAMDYRGHGQSGGRRAHVDEFDEYLSDLGEFLSEIERDGFTRRPILLGHSLGGLICARFAQLYPERVSHLALSSPFMGLAIKLPTIKNVLGKAMSRWLPTFSLPTGVDPAWLSHDREIVDGYAADPLVSHHASARWFTEVVRAQQDTLINAHRLEAPLLVLQAGQDKLASIDSTKRFVEAAGSQDKHLEIYRDLFHEVFNETNRGEVYSALTEWLAKHIS